MSELDCEQLTMVNGICREQARLFRGLAEIGDEKILIQTTKNHSHHINNFNHGSDRVIGNLELVGV